MDRPVAWFRREGHEPRPTWRTYWLHQDFRDNVTAVSHHTGQVRERWRYDAFGQSYVPSRQRDGSPSWSRSAASALGNRKLFAARDWDQPSGTYWNRARAYSPTLGRFLQRDPLGYADGANPYAYVGNGPWGATDPTGLAACKIALAKNRTAIVLSIFAQPSEDDSALGHVWLEIKKGNAIHSYALWSEQAGRMEKNSASMYLNNGVHIDFDLNYSKDTWYKHYNSTSIFLTEDKYNSLMDAINTDIQSEKMWTGLENCSSWAIGKWNLVASDKNHLDPDGLNLPDALHNYIKSIEDKPAK